MDPSVDRERMALAAFDRGWSLTPLNGKVPILPAWQKAPKPSRDEVSLWARERNVGLRTGRVSGVVVVDVDPRHGGAIPDWALHAPRVKTGSGGWHCYFAAPDRAVPNSAGKLGPGLDVKADGGQVVLVGGVHPDTGRPYTWEQKPERTLPALPAGVVEQLVRKPKPAPPPQAQPVHAHEMTAYGRRAFEDEITRVEGAKEGTRNDTLTKSSFALGQLAAGGQIPTIASLDSLIVAARKAGLSEEEATNTAKRAFAAGEANPRRPAEDRATEPRRSPAKATAPNPFEDDPPRDPSPQDGNTEAQEPLGFTDLDNCYRIVRLYGDRLRHTAAHGWLVWDGKRWQLDTTGRAVLLAKAAVVSVLMEADRAEESGETDRAKQLRTWAVRSRAAPRIEAALKLAQSEPEIAARGEEFDRDPWLLNVQNGTVDLRTGKLREHRQADRITKICGAAYDPTKTSAPKWAALLERCQPDPQIRKYLHRWAGYSLTGATVEQCFLLHYGLGANGKSTFTETLAGILHEYAATAPFDTFLVKRPGQATADVARLAGARMVLASEPDEGARMSESVVKQITGGDKMTARHLYRDFFTFSPEFKLFLVGNHKPRIRGTDHGIWRRVRLIPWTVAIPESEQDRDLKTKLVDEYPAILAWAVKGCLDWQREGLGTPASVVEATTQYRTDEDQVGQFLEDCTTRAEGSRILARDLRAAYERWCADNGEIVLSQQAMGRRIAATGYESKKYGGVKSWAGMDRAGEVWGRLGTFGPSGAFSSHSAGARDRGTFTAEGPIIPKGPHSELLGFDEPGYTREPGEEG